MCYFIEGEGWAYRMEKTLAALDKKLSLHIQKSDTHMYDMKEFREQVSLQLNPVYAEFIFQSRLKRKRMRDLKLVAMWLGIPATMSSIVYILVKFIN